MALKRLNKRGSEELFMPEIIILILTILFFSTIMYFIEKTSSSALFYEEVYAKKIGLILESSQSGDVYKIDVTKPWEVAKKNKWDSQYFSDNFIKIDSENHLVFIRLDSKGGYKFAYFSNKIVDKPVINFNQGGATLVFAVK